MALPPVGAQLLVFGAKYNLNTDTDLILDCVARAGYAGVEGAAKDHARYRRQLDERGLRFGATHTGVGALRDVTPLVQMLETLGGADVNISGLLTWEGRTLEDYRGAIAIMNEAGRRLRDAGIHLHYHNHDFEFEKVDGEKTGMDLLLDGLDFDAVDLCVDVAWVLRGGADPATFLRAHRDSIGFLHFKDHDGEQWSELGRGQVDYAGVMAVLPELTGARWVMIEQDSTRMDPCDSAAISRAYLRETFGY
ncbi:MAG TPA: sugar phosphate isomerase/epimerase [Armatimonadota bacterium]|nr:sugar phosphate isomerase/epimerase [Armatimonadota bacterium]